MGLAACVNYVQSILDGLTWPTQMQALPNPPGALRAFVQPPNPDIEVGSTPTAYIWFERWNESRNPAKYGAGTVPRGTATKAIEHTIPVWFVWEGGLPSDPTRNTLFPGMLDAIQAFLRTSRDPAQLTDPWTGATSWAVDVGENITGLGYLRDLAPMQLQREDALLSVSVVEVIQG